MFTVEQLLEIQRRLQEIGVKDSQFPDAHPLTGGERVPILQDSENRLMDVITFKEQVTGFPDLVSKDKSVRVEKSLNDVDLRVKCYVSNEESGWAEAPLFFEEGNNNTDTGSCKNFQRFMLNDKAGRVITVDVIGKYLIASEDDITIKVTGDVELTDMFDLVIKKDNSTQGYYGKIMFSSKYRVSNENNDLLFLQAISDKSNIYPENINFDSLTEVVHISGLLKDYKTTSDAKGLVGKTGKACFLLESMMSGLFDFLKHYGGIIGYISIKKVAYGDDDYDDENKKLSDEYRSQLNTMLGYLIDCIKGGIEMDEITPKVLTEWDDRGIGLYCFLEAKRHYDAFNNGGGSDFPISKSTKSGGYGISQYGTCPFAWGHNAVVLKQDNDVMKCIEENIELFFIYVQMYGYNIENNEDRPLTNHGDMPVSVAPYDDFSGIYTDAGMYSGGKNPPRSNNLEKSVRKAPVKNYNIEVTQEQVNALKEEFLNKIKERFAKKPSNNANVKTKSTNNSVRAINGDDDIDALYYEIMSLLNPQTEASIDNLFMLPSEFQTFEFKKIAIGFYKYFKLFEGLDSTWQNVLIQSNFGDYQEYINLLNILATGLWDYPPTTHQQDLAQVLSEFIEPEFPQMLVNREEWQTKIKAIYEAINDFDVLLGSGQNVPYEDTCSIYFKYEDVWYEVITPFRYYDVSSGNDRLFYGLQSGCFEPGREYKLVHLGDWKHVSSYYQSSFDDPDLPYEGNEDNYSDDPIKLI